MKLRLGLSVLALGAGVLVAGCGADEEQSTVTPAQAITEIAEVRSGIDAALASYASGDAAKADEQVGDAYLEHFELVEGPLDKADHELNEKLEHDIRENLREKIKAQAPAAEVTALAETIKADLDKAEALLR